MDHFINSTEHLLAELERIDLLIQVQIARARQLFADDEQFRGLYISERELDALLTQPVGRPRWFQDDSAAGQPESALLDLKRQIDLCRRNTLGQGNELRLDSLQRLFCLNNNEIDIVLIVLANELDLRYERLYAYLQDDVTKKKPTVDLALSLLQLTASEKIRGLQLFYEDAPLLIHHLITVYGDPAYPDQPLLAKSLKLDARIVQYLLESDKVDERIYPHAILDDQAPSIQTDEYQLNANLIHRFDRLHESGWFSPSAILNLCGANLKGKLAIARRLAQASGMSLLVIDVESLITAKDISFEFVLSLINREARLLNAAIYWEHADALLDIQCRTLFDVFNRNLKTARAGAVFVSTHSGWNPAGQWAGLRYLQIDLPAATFIERLQLWSDSLRDDLLAHQDLDIGPLAGRFKFSGEQIQSAVATAKTLALWQEPQNGQIRMKHLYEACRIHSNPKLSALAWKITPKYQWDDIVLPADRSEQLREICNHVKYRDRVYGEWGFERKLAMGKGLCVLFAGPSGTGKTMAADIIAGELGMDLYKIDLSAVVSKYIGETEKNLSRIFSEAQTSNAILFFDEADALFGKRSEVKDAHDRYANIETGYLLQKMEEHEGVVILATNFRKNMDEAFVRRLHFTVEFPFPTEEDRLRIWQGVWPDATPRGQGLDLEFLAGRFQFTGGNIRNIALSAAFLAADDNGVVEMQHLLRATQREYQKMGKVVSESDFGLQYKGIVAFAKNL